MIVLFTDFGFCGPYVGQMRAVLARVAPGIPVIELFNDAPAFDPLLSAYLLAAYVEEFPVGTVFLCVVDPGVGSAARKPVVVRVDGRWFVGPDNGLFEVVARRGEQAVWHEITWRPEKLSATFHGRDLFAPVAAMLTQGTMVESLTMNSRPGFTGPEELTRIVYIDAYGNAMTGIRSAQVPHNTRLVIAGRNLSRVTTFADAPPGEAFWYANANGLVEIAVNQGNAATILQLSLGDELEIKTSSRI